MALDREKQTCCIRVHALSDEMYESKDITQNDLKDNLKMNNIKNDSL